VDEPALLVLHYDVTVDDLRQAWLGHRPTWPLELPAALLLLAFGAWQVSVAASMAAWVVVLVSAGWLLHHATESHRLADAWRETARALKGVVLEVSESGLVARTPWQETRAEWAAYTDAHELESGFLLYRGAEFAVVPIAAFPRPEELDAFRNVLGRHIEGPRWRRSRRRFRAR
jgi:hypothetical protein